MGSSEPSASSSQVYPPPLNLAASSLGDETAPGANSLGSKLQALGLSCLSGPDPIMGLNDSEGFSSAPSAERSSRQLDPLVESSPRIPEVGGEWVAYRTPDGQTYYSNGVVTQWEEPELLREARLRSEARQFGESPHVVQRAKTEAEGSLAEILGLTYISSSQPPQSSSFKQQRQQQQQQEQHSSQFSAGNSQWMSTSQAPAPQMAFRAPGPNHQELSQQVVMPNNFDEGSKLLQMLQSHSRPEPVSMPQSKPSADVPTSPGSRLLKMLRSIPIDGGPDGADAESGDILNPEPAVKEDRKVKQQPQWRTCRNIIGTIAVAGVHGRGGRGSEFVRPKAPLTVQWELPASAIDFFGGLPDQDRSQQLMLGLYRRGVASNTGSIISKRLLDGGSNPRSSSRGIVHGTMPFFAPKSLGMFVFRIYDENSPSETLAMSPPWGVGAQGRDVELSARFILSQLRASVASNGKGAVGALGQLAFALRHTDDLPPPRYSKSLAGTLWNAVSTAWQLLHPIETVDESDGRRMRTVHGAVHDALSALLSSPAPRQMLQESSLGPQPDPSNVFDGSAEPVRLVEQWQQLWCRVEERYFPSPQAMHQHYMDDMGFRPSELPVELVPQSVTESLTADMREVLQRLVPSGEFLTIREGVRQRLEDIILRDVALVPPGTVLQVFGSSVNGFGTNSADLDMCIMYPSDRPPPENHSDVIEAIASALTNLGMEEVDSRSTARIPIVLFKDPVSGLDCDISVMNPLAVKNSALLRTYAYVDPRVRWLGHIVKYWARCRRINNASEGTLSSYGYILCVLNFLQTRNPPLVPNLQNLPVGWPRGGDSASVPRVMTRHLLDGRACDTYFFNPQETSYGQSALQEFASRNKETPGELLVAFFRRFALEFDCRQHVVSLLAGGARLKEHKAEVDCWPQSSRLSIEDPFETWYDVAHVLKWSRYKHVRLEFLRAYSLIARWNGDTASLLGSLCEPAPTPPFLLHEDERETGEHGGNVLQEGEAEST
jgi:DNA polymerase sigma